MRVLRQENWLVALIDNDVLPLDTYLPLVGTRPLLPQTLEWALYTSLVSRAAPPALPARRAAAAWRGDAEGLSGARPPRASIGWYARS